MDACGTGPAPNAFDRDARLIGTSWICSNHAGMVTVDGCRHAACSLSPDVGTRLGFVPVDWKSNAALSTGNIRGVASEVTLWGRLPFGAGRDSALHGTVPGREIFQHWR